VNVITTLSMLYGIVLRCVASIEISTWKSQLQDVVAVVRNYIALKWLNYEKRHIWRWLSSGLYRRVVCTVLQPRRQPSTHSPSWKLLILHKHMSPILRNMKIAGDLMQHLCCCLYVMSLISATIAITRELCTIITRQARIRTTDKLLPISSSFKQNFSRGLTRVITWHGIQSS
jgi:hypothetical protein